MLQLTKENFKSEVLDSDVPVVVDFFATWCGPCKMLAPVVEELAEEYDGKVKICKLDVDEASSVAAQYSIMSVPTLVFFKDGSVVNKAVGGRPKTDLEELVDELL